MNHPQSQPRMTGYASFKARACHGPSFTVYHPGDSSSGLRLHIPVNALEADDPFSWALGVLMRSWQMRVCPDPKSECRDLHPANLHQDRQLVGGLFMDLKEVTALLEVTAHHWTFPAEVAEMATGETWAVHHGMVKHQPILAKHPGTAGPV